MKSFLLECLLVAIVACSSGSGGEPSSKDASTADGAHADGSSADAAPEASSTGCPPESLCNGECCPEGDTCATLKGETKCFQACTCGNECPKSAPCCQQLEEPDGGGGLCIGICLPQDQCALSWCET
jgi:hypothetical protein